MRVSEHIANYTEEKKEQHVVENKKFKLNVITDYHEISNRCMRAIINVAMLFIRHMNCDTCSE